MEFLQFPLFWWFSALLPPRPQNALFSQAKSMVFGAILRKVTQFRQFYHVLMILGDFPPISLKKVEIAFSHFSRNFVHRGTATHVLGGVENHEAQTASTTNAGI